MNNRPTPETDAAIYKVYEGPKFDQSVHEVVDPIVSRKIERERDEEREKYDKLAKEREIIINKLCKKRDEAIARSFKWSDWCVQYMTERDEAREALREIWKSGDAFLPHVDLKTINRWRKAAGWQGTK